VTSVPLLFDARGDRQRFIRVVLALTPILLLVASLTAPAQTIAQEPAPAVDAAGTRTGTELSPALIEDRIARVEADASLTEDAKKPLLEQYRAALSNLQQQRTYSERAAVYRNALQTAPDETAAIRSALEADGDTLPDPPITLPKNAGVSEIERLLAKEQAEAAGIETEISEVRKVLDETRDSTAVRDQLIKAKDALERVEAELQQTPENQSGDQGSARRWSLESRRDLLRTQIEMLDLQMQSADARRALAAANLDRLEARLRLVKARRAHLEDRANQLRRIDAERARAETEAAERETADADPRVRALAEQNRELGETITAVTGRLDRLDERQAEIEQRTERVSEDFRTTRQRLEAAGLNRALGQVLLDRRRQLPDLRTLRKEAAERAEAIAESTLSQIRLEEELRSLRDLNAWLDAALAGLPPEAQAPIRPELREQAEKRVELLRQAAGVQDRYRRALGEIDFAALRLREAVDAYEDYLSERLLWVRSMVPISEQSFAAFPAALYWVISPGNWTEFGRGLMQVAPRSPLMWLGLVAVVLLIWRGGAIRRKIRATADHLRRVSTDRFSYTLQALGLTLLAAATWPLLLLTLGLPLAGSAQAPDFAKAVGAALVAVAPALYYLRAFRLLCMPNGVADRHFRWSSDVLKLLRSSFAYAAALLLPIGFVAALAHRHGDPLVIGTLGRIAQVLFNLGLAAFTAVVLHPRRGALKHLLAANPHGWPNRLRNLWYTLLVAVPLALAALALGGYLYASGTLLRSLVSELWLVLGLVVVHQLIVRWLISTRRSLALQAALERRATREAQKDTPDAGGTASLGTVEESVDLASLDNQTRRLLNSMIVIAAGVGLWVIWSDVLPALSLLERVQLWTYQASVDGVDTAVPVTLADIGLVLVIVFVAIAAAKNLPALLEILLLKNTGVTPGGRYTITTLTGYAITAAGVLLVVGTLGLSWGEVQWLVAALGVGIGFGLQEIVANFISGLIILFERPVRVGDIVSIGDTTGVVTKIEIRATTIRNWDRQELLVPNKEFITGRLLNWTLTDQTNRVVVTIGVEYGSDTRKALELLSRIAAENPRVMTDPPPVITFEGFGDNALTLVLRCYLESLDYRLAVTTELHQAIDDAFRAAGIGIAFPQRDIHLRSAEPLEIRLRRGARGSAEIADERSDAASGPAAAD
jgi:potassium efflux system protein